VPVNTGQKHAIAETVDLIKQAASTSKAFAPVVNPPAEFTTDSEGTVRDRAGQVVYTPPTRSPAAPRNEQDRVAGVPKPAAAKKG